MFLLHHVLAPWWTASPQAQSKGANESCAGTSQTVNQGKALSLVFVLWWNANTSYKIIFWYRKFSNSNWYKIYSPLLLQPKAKTPKPV
jgi:hypothetical protein